LDSHFERSRREGSGLTWYPWVGKNYQKQKHRILVVAESHYTDEVSPQKAQENVKKYFNDVQLTRDVVAGCPINGDWSNVTFSNMHRALLGTTDFEGYRFWQEIAFYNFIQRPMQIRGDLRERPTPEDFFAGWKTFISVAELLQPSCCIFIGLAASNYLNQALDDLGIEHTALTWGDTLNNVYLRNPVTISIKSRKVDTLFIKHTSTFFSWECWNEYLNKHVSKEISYLKDLIHTHSQPNSESSKNEAPISLNKVRTSGLPSWLSHKPVLACRYEDASLSVEDAKFISIGKATYGQDCASIKIWRKTKDENRWSRQSEEVPIHRVGYLMQMLLAAVRLVQAPDGEPPVESALREEIQTEDCISFLRKAISSDREAIKKSLSEIKRLINGIDIESI